MKTAFNHVQFNIDPANAGFYRELFGFLGWRTVHEGNGSLGIADGTCSLWFMAGTNGSVNDHDGPGFNHIGIGTESQIEVETTADYLRHKQVELLYGTPCHRPEYAGEDGVYYSAMFESPDRILIEVVYAGPTIA